MTGCLAHLLDAQGQRTDEVCLRVVVAQLDGLHVRIDQRRFLGVGLSQEFPDTRKVEIEQRREHARVADVFHQDARAHTLEVIVAQAGQRHPKHCHIVTLQQRRSRPSGVIDEVATRCHLAHIACVGLGVHADHDVDLARARDMAILRHADLVPGRQTLDVGGEVVLAHHRDAAAEDRLHQQRIGARRTGAVDRGDLDGEVVDARRHSAHRATSWSIACGHLTHDFCMSQAAVGQRSAQSPQCTQTSSSFTITRPVCLSGSLT